MTSSSKPQSARSCSTDSFSALPSAPPAPLIERLRKPQRLLLTSHSNPDGDAVGSQVGIYRLLCAAGHRVTAWNLDPVPRIYEAFLADLPWYHGVEPPRGFPQDFDLVICMECPTLERSGLPSLADIPAINIDHHLGNTNYGVENWVEPGSASVSQMVLEIARAAGWEIDSATAQGLYLGLATDTGGFRYSNANAIAFRHAAELVELGASPEETAHQVYERRTLASILLQGAMFAAADLSCEGKVAVGAITSEMFERCGAQKDDTEGLIESLRTLDGVVAVALLREVEPRVYKASLRSRGTVSVEPIARRHGGGGHQKAAGCKLTGELGTLRLQLAEELAQAVLEAEQS